jgi:hypothetical protein
MLAARSTLDKSLPWSLNVVDMITVGILSGGTAEHNICKVKPVEKNNAMRD